jgi:hypothetical protein
VNHAAQEQSIKGLIAERPLHSPTLHNPRARAYNYLMVSGCR